MSTTSTTPTDNIPEAKFIHKVEKDATEVQKTFSRIKLNNGISIAELSENHRVVLFCIKWKLVDKIGEMFVSLTQMNTIPVIAHQEYDFKVKAYLERKKDPFVKSLLFCRLDKDARKVMQLGGSSLGQHIKALPQIVSNIDRFDFPVGVIDPLAAFGFFMIEKGNIIKEVVFQELSKKLQFGKFLQDLRPSDMLDYDYIARIIKLFPDLDMHSSRRLSKDLSMNWTKLMQDDKEIKIFKDSLLDLLKDERKRWFFKAHATNEFAHEGILFWEEATAYRSIQDKNIKKAKANKIFNYYLSPDGISQINTEKKYIETVVKALKEEAYEDELFDDLIADIQQNVLCDIYFRFKKSTLWDEMNSEKVSIRLVC